MSTRTIRGVRFRNIGPVDRRLSVSVTPQGRHLCPLCQQSSVRRQVGMFGVGNRYFMEHLRMDHWKCQCGWIGTKPGQHVVRAPNHEGPVKFKRLQNSTVRISDLQES